MSKKKKHERLSWCPPENYKEFFSPLADEDFKAEHPIGYYILALFGVTVLLLPGIVFAFALSDKGAEGYWPLLGLAGGFVFGIGLFNYVGIIIKQFLGHWVSIISYLLGGAMMYFTWIMC